MNGLLFPGQGSQAVGMGRTLYDSFTPAKKLLDQANDILGYDLKTLMFEGPQERLTDTKYAQPAIYTCSAMYLEKVKDDNLEYGFVAGHSLGEYAALLAAGVYTFEEGLRLVSQRGYAMGCSNKGAMAAVIGLSEEELKEYMAPGIVMANLNSKNQIVVSGEEAKIDDIESRLTKKENVKVKRLHVSAAFHSPQMQEAAEKMRDIIEKNDFKEPSCHVVPNVTGRPTHDIAEIKSNLIAQITGQVRWYDTIMSMKNAGVSMLYEVGYGDVLRKLNRTITFRPKCVGVEIGRGNGNI